ncbi:hypothetical protein ACFE04_000541 [Oxalis oulophora]
MLSESQSSVSHPYCTNGCVELRSGPWVTRKSPILTKPNEVEDEFVDVASATVTRLELSPVVCVYTWKVVSFCVGSEIDDELMSNEEKMITKRMPIINLAILIYYQGY